MSEKKSQFIEVETLTDSQYVPVFGSGVDRKISKPNLFSQIKDESFSPFIYPTIAILQSADLEVDVDNPTYCRCEETEYRLYKITNAAPGVDDITLTNGNTAEYQIEYRDTGFVASVATAATGALAVFTDSTGQEIDKSVVPTNTGKALVQAADSASIAFPRKNADNTVTMRSASQYFDDIKQSATHGAAGVIKTADGTSTLAQTATDEAITPANLATLKASNAETLTGTDDTKYITPENLQHKLESDGVLIIENFAALASTPASQGQVVLLCSAPSRLFKAESGTLVSDGISVSPSATSGVGWRYLTDYNSQRKGSFSLVIDTTDDYVRDTVLPIVTSAGYRAALAVPLTSLQSDYTRMTLAELHEYCRANNSEVLAHGTNGIALDNTVAGSIGESWIRTSKFDLNRFGFDANFYVAISSVLDSKFLPETKKWFDAAYVVSGSETTPTTSTNSEDSDMYNLVRVALEGGTLSNLQKLADYAKANFRNVVFYTHDSTENLSGILSYCSSIGLECETPTEWLSRVRGIRKTNTSRGSENLINNSIFARQKTTDLAPIGWSLSTSTMTGLASYYYAGEFGYEIDINATAAAADERALFSYTYPSGPISEYTPFCFSCYAYGPNVSNTTVRMRLIAKRC
ncbi:MAG: hypothetical protein IPK77_10645 [Cellvibrio sp.]|nr:hypothetical protein [Cellvibrio sp.]